MRRAAAVVLAGALVAGACSSGGGSSSSSPSSPAAQRSTLRIGLEAPRSLDPLLARSTSEVVLADLLFDGLTTLAGDGTAEVHPALADRWTSSADAKQWDFHVRDGAPGTAADAVASLRRAAATPASGVAGPLSGAGVDEVDGGVRIRFAAPVPDAPALLSHPAFGVVPAGATSFDASSFAGSGPFVLSSRRGDRLVLRAAPGRGVHLREIDVTTGDLAALSSQVPRSLDWSLVPPGATSHRSGESASPLLATLFYGFNVKVAPFDDPRLREAAVRAVDRDAIVRNVYGDGMVAIDGPLPLQVPGAVADACGDRCRHDVDAARALVRAAGATAPKVSVDVEDEPAQVAVAKTIVAALQGVGFDAAVRTHAAGDYATFLGSGQAQLFRFGWVATWPSAAAFLPPVFRSGAPTNVLGYASPTVDAALAGDDWTGAERAIMADVPVLPIGQFRGLAVAAPAVHGLRRNLFGSFDGASVSLSR